MKIVFYHPDEVVTVVLCDKREITVSGAGTVRIDGVPRSVTRTDVMMAVAEAARYLKCSRSHLYEKFRSGEISSVRIDGARLVARSSLDSYLSRQQETIFAQSAKQEQVSEVLRGSRFLAG